MTTRRASERTPLLRELPPEPVDVDADVTEQQARSTENQYDESTPSPDEPGLAYLSLVLGTLWIGVFFAALDTTIIATLSSPISDSFHSFKLFSWLATAYMIANAALQPLSGRLTDIFGRRQGIVVANIFFGAGTLICGLAKSEWVMILGRVISGLGGGCLNTIAVFVASDLIPLRRRGLWQGFGNLFFGLGSGLGGVFGGWIHDVWDWRWAFLIQVPFIVFSGTLAWFVVKIPVKESNKSRLKQVDFLGSATLITAVVLLLLGLNSGGNTVPWNHPLVYVSLPMAFVFFVAFVLVEDRVPQPVIPVRLLLDRTVLSANLVNWFLTMGFFGFLYYAPIFFQVQGYSATSAGARLIASSVGTAVGSLLTGYLTKLTGRYYVMNVVVEATMVVSMGMLTVVMKPELPEWPVFVVFFFAGLCYAGMLTISLLALISAVDHKYQAVITSSSYAFRSTGSTIGISVASAVFQNILNRRLWQVLGDEENAGELIERLAESIKELNSLGPRLYPIALRAYLDALQGVWWTVLGFIALGGVVSLFMREHTLHSNLARK